MLRKLTFVALLCLLSPVSYAQGRFAVLRGVFKPRPPAIQRIETVRISQFWDARAAMMTQHPTSFDFRERGTGHLVLTTEKILTEHSIKHPIRYFGPHGALHAQMKAAKIENMVSRRFLDEWSKINDVKTYRGSHHLVNKYTLKLIHADLKAAGKKVSLSEMQFNAPAIFHPLHGDPAFQETFHDAEAQYEDYKKFGMQVVVMSKLAAIDELNRAHGLPAFSEEYIQGVLLEAKFWCRNYGLNWDQPFPY